MRDVNSHCMYCGQIGMDFEKYETPLGLLQFCGESCWKYWIESDELESNGVKIEYGKGIH